MECKTNDIHPYIARAYEVRRPMYINGQPGIGKSDVVREMARRTAARKGRTLVEWNKISADSKRDLEANRPASESGLFDELRLSERGREMRKDARLLDACFLLADQRLAQMDPSDIKMPVMGSGEYVEWRPTLVIKTLAHPAAEGFLFFDEISLAPPTLQGLSFQIILDHCVGETRLSDGVYVIAAGNSAADCPGAHDLKVALSNRFVHIRQTPPDIRGWEKWAISNELDSRVINFLNSRPDCLVDDLELVKKNRAQAFASPRSWEFCSDLVKGEPTGPMIEKLANQAVGARSMEFASFCDLTEAMDIMEYLDRPEEVERLSMDKKWALMSSLSEHYKADPKLFDRVVAMMGHLGADLKISIIRMMSGRRGTPQWTRFCADAGKSKEMISLMKEHQKYLEE